MATIRKSYPKPALKADLRKLTPSPQTNPFAVAQTITTRKREKLITREQPLVNPVTGEIIACPALHLIKEMDEAKFVKVFAAGIQAAFGLTKTGHRIFQLILNEYEKTPIGAKRYADSVDLYWFGQGIEGRDVGVSEYTFKRGLRELIDFKFLYPRTTTSYWVNPVLFFKGDRVMFINEWRIKRENNKHTYEHLNNAENLQLTNNKPEES